jgi:NTP pyrophosphatase (non-canonical NTP hydrolase)
MKLEREFKTEADKEAYYQNELTNHGRRIATQELAYYLAERLLKMEGVIHKTPTLQAQRWTTRLDIIRGLETINNVNYDYFGITSISEALWDEYKIGTVPERPNYFDLEQKVKIWAANRQILAKDNAYKQYLKFVEESGELARAILKSNEADTVDAFGDVMVTLIILSEQLGYNLTNCLKAAYNEIKDREGQTINGVFIKEEK